MKSTDLGPGGLIRSWLKLTATLVLSVLTWKTGITRHTYLIGVLLELSDLRPEWLFEEHLAQLSTT